MAELVEGLEEIGEMVAEMVVKMEEILNNLSYPSYDLCLLPSTTFLALVSLFLFSVMNYREARAFFLSS